MRHSGRGCGTAELTFLGELPEPEEDDASVGGMDALLIGRAGPSTLAEVPEHTPLSWDDGESAGTTQSVVRWREDPTLDAGRLCFDLRVGPEWKSAGYLDERVRVCAPEDAVVRPTE